MVWPGAGAILQAREDGLGLGGGVQMKANCGLRGTTSAGVSATDISLPKCKYTLQEGTSVGGLSGFISEASGFISTRFSA